MHHTNLLTPNDYKRIQTALDNQKEDYFSVRFGDYAIAISVVPTGKAESVWNQPYIITVEQSYPNVYARKNCKNVNDLKTYLSVAKERE